jgi:hypothetical protein
MGGVVMVIECLRAMRHGKHHFSVASRSVAILTGTHLSIHTISAFQKRIKHTAPEIRLISRFNA